MKDETRLRVGVGVQPWLTGRVSRSRGRRGRRTSGRVGGNRGVENGSDRFGGEHPRCVEPRREGQDRSQRNSGSQVGAAGETVDLDRASVVGVREVSLERQHPEAAEGCENDRKREARLPDPHRDFSLPAGGQSVKWIIFPVDHFSRRKRPNASGVWKNSLFTACQLIQVRRSGGPCIR